MCLRLAQLAHIEELREGRHVRAYVLHKYKDASDRAVMLRLIYHWSCLLFPALVIL
jgi:hypothetical protein